MKLRWLDPADARAYRALRLQALLESPTAFSASPADEAGRSLDEVAARITPAADGSRGVLGVFEQQALVGFLAVLHPQREKLRHGIELAGVYVDPAFRCRGCGRLLLQGAIGHAASIAGVRQLRLGVTATNRAARVLYESLGFVSYGVQPEALQVDGSFHDEVHYLLRLDRAEAVIDRAAPAR